MLILAIDTSTKTASIAILHGEDILSEFFLNLERDHGETILSAIRSLLDATGIQVGEIDLFACTTGPGSFTGLRVGIATIKGFAFATEKPVVGVSTLDALAQNLTNVQMLICPMLDARKKQVYTAFYTPDSSYIHKKVGEETVIDPEMFVRSIKGEVIFLGDGAHKYASLIKEILPQRAFFAPSYHSYIRASQVGLIGLKKYHDSDILNFVNFVPHYIRASEAEAKKLLK